MTEGFKPGHIRTLLRNNYLIDKVVIPNKNPEIRPDGMVVAPIILEASVDVRSKYGRVSPKHFLPHLVNATADEVYDGLADGFLPVMLWNRSRKTVYGKLQGASDEYYYELLTAEMTRQVTMMETACMLLYSSKLMQQYIKEPDSIKQASIELSRWFEQKLRENLMGLGYSDSRLLDSISVEPYKVNQVKSGKFKFRVRIGILVKMMAYGFILDIGRGPTTPGKHIPFKAIFAWCKRKGITPKEGSTFSHMVLSIRKKIDEVGYPEHPFIKPALEECVANGLPEYFIWKKLGNSLEMLMKKAAKRSKRKYSGFRKTIGDYTITIK